jgi:hypothetical protein
MPSHSPSPAPPGDVKPTVGTGKRTRQVRAKSEAKPSERTNPATAATRGAWTADEYTALFKHVVHHGPGRAGLANAVPGRTANQCYWAWRWVWQRARHAAAIRADASDVVEPTCRSALEAKAGGRRR